MPRVGDSRRLSGIGRPFFGIPLGLNPDRTVEFLGEQIDILAGLVASSPRKDRARLRGLRVVGDGA